MSTFTLDKLRLDKYSRVQLLNFPNEYQLPIDHVDTNPEVIIYFINDLEDVEAFYQVVKNAKLPKDNRVIFVYKKGRKDGVNRDTIYGPFKTGRYKGFKMRAPMMCSISKELSGFVQSYEGE